MVAAEDRAAWLDARRLGIGGSDVAAVLGVSKWRSAHDVWREKTGRDCDHGETDTLIRGRVVEAALRAAYEADAGVILERPAILVGREPWMRYSPDGILPGARLLWEGKTTTLRDEWSEDDSECDSRTNGLMPRDYALQVAWGLEVADCDAVDVSAAFVPFAADDLVREMLAAGAGELAIGRGILALSEIRHYHVTREPDFGAALVAAVGDWWQRHVVEDAEPDFVATERAREWVSRTFPQETEPLRPATPEEAGLVSAWAAACAATAAAERAEADLAERLKRSIGNAAGVEVAQGRVTWKWQAGRESIDGKRLRAERPDVAAAYTNHGAPFRVLRRSWRG
jgi:putative phage-type endonuclease